MSLHQLIDYLFFPAKVSQHEDTDDKHASLQTALLYKPLVFELMINSHYRLSKEPVPLPAAGRSKEPS